MCDISRLLVISPDSQFSPSYLARSASALEKDIFIKQTCYGILIEGKKEDIEYVVKEIRKIDPNRIYSKMRAFPLGDKRRCRAQNGSARPGFYFLEKEIEALPLIAKGLDCIDEEYEEDVLSLPKKLSLEQFKKIAEESV